MIFIELIMDVKHLTGSGIVYKPHWILNISKTDVGSHNEREGCDNET